MSVQSNKIIKTVTIIVVMGLVVSACGRRGALQTPVNATVVTSDQAGNPIEKTTTKPDKPFILDGLI